MIPKTTYSKTIAHKGVTKDIEVVLYLSDEGFIDEVTVDGSRVYRWMDSSQSLEGAVNKAEQRFIKDVDEDQHTNSILTRALDKLGFIKESNT